MFANSPYETKTSTEKAFVQSFANQVGDIGAIMTAVLVAVFFTILLVTGNTMAQSVRERTSELAVLKTLGFTNGLVLTLVLAESTVIAVAGGGLGLLLAWGFVRQGDPTGGLLPAFYLPPGLLALGGGLALALGRRVRPAAGRAGDAAPDRRCAEEGLGRAPVAAPDRRDHDGQLRSLPRRIGSSTVAVVGISGVVIVFVAVLSIAEGFQRTLLVTGSPDTVIVLRAGSDTEMTSGLTGEQARIIRDAPGIARGPDGPVASAELFVILSHPRIATGTDANIPLRGVQPAAFAVRGDVKIVEGRLFEWGRNEIIVGRAAANQYVGLTVGSTHRWGENEWTVVGIFEAGGGVPESEIWADAGVVQPAYRRGNSYQAVYARLTSPGAFDRFKDALTTDPRLNVKVVREIDYYAEQSVLLHRLIRTIGFLIAFLMGIGAVFGAVNTMYTAVAARTREIATLRALGSAPCRSSRRCSPSRCCSRWSAASSAACWPTPASTATRRRPSTGRRSARLPSPSPSRRASWPRASSTPSSWASWAACCRPSGPPVSPSSRRSGSCEGWPKNQGDVQTNGDDGRGGRRPRLAISRLRASCFGGPGHSGVSRQQDLPDRCPLTTVSR